jgi:hypothetical protein
MEVENITVFQHLAIGKYKATHNISNFVFSAPKEIIDFFSIWVFGVTKAISMAPAGKLFRTAY